MIAAHIENGVVVNMVLVDAFTENFIDPTGAKIGDLWDGEKFSSSDISAEEYNAPILAQLADIDAKSIRPLREGETARVRELAEQAAILRSQLRKA